mgnify:FL=1
MVGHKLNVRYLTIVLAHKAVRYSKPLFLASLKTYWRVSSLIQFQPYQPIRGVKPLGLIRT